MGKGLRGCAESWIPKIENRTSRKRNFKWKKLLKLLVTQIQTHNLNHHPEGPSISPFSQQRLRNKAICKIIHTHKVRHHLRTRAAQGINEASSTDSQPPPGFEFVEQRHNSLIQTPNQSKTVLVEDSCSPININVQERNEVQEHVGQVNIHGVVRSNVKRALLHEPSSSTSTEKTSESLKQLAHDSLKVGELLGVKFIGSYAAAVSRITKPLKRATGKKKCSNREASDN